MTEYESKALKEEYKYSEKAMLKSEVDNVVRYIDYMKEQTEKRLRSELQGRVNEAIDIANNLYKENVESKSLEEIKKMAKDALRPIRFLDGRGYYFAFSMDGIETLFADRPEMEGMNMLPVQGAKGEYVVKDMIDLIKRLNEGFYKYTWTKPLNKEKSFSKIAFVKYFKPFDWVFGTGEYIDDFTNQIQEQVLERIVNIRFKDQGYFFGSLEGGYPLFTNGKITKGSDRIWDLTDPNGVKIIQEQHRVSKNPDGGFIEYSWHKLSSSKPATKISFVREISDWGWTIGAGVYLDNIEKIIAENKNTLFKQFIKKIIIGFCVFVGFVILMWIWAKRVASGTQKTIEKFEDSFQRATTSFTTIPDEDMQFSELSRIAKSANKMIALQKQSEDQLKENEQRYKSAQRMGRVGNWEYDLVNETFWGSEFSKQVYGFDPQSERFTTEVVESCIPERERVHQALIDLIEKDSPYNLEFDICPISGPETRTIRSIAEVVRDETGNALKVMGVVHDITEQKKSVKEKEKLENQLRQAQKIESIGKLAGGIAHDFNNILYPIIGFTQLSIEELPKDHPVQENLVDILEGAKRARDLVKRILLFSRQQDQVFRPTSLKPVIEETLKLLRSSTPANVSIQSSLYDGKACVTCDETHIHEIVMNLCTNANHALEKSGGEIRIDLSKIKPEENLKLPIKDYLCLSVADNGIGIPENEIDKIFDPYFTTKEIGKGSGLGLSVVHGIVTNYNGDISVRSKHGKGTNIRVYLPVTDPGDIEQEVQNEQEELSGTERILFVDDEKSIVKLGIRVLQRQGYHLTGEQDSVNALKLISSDPQNFDLVITDMAMPKMDGLQFAEKIYEINPDIPILICSGFSEKLDRTINDLPSVKANLDKPLQVEDLTKKVREILDQNRGN